MRAETEEEADARAFEIAEQLSAAWNAILKEHPSLSSGDIVGATATVLVASGISPHDVGLAFVRFGTQIVDDA